MRVQPNLASKKNVNGGTRVGVRGAPSVSSLTTAFTITPRVVYQTVRMDGWNRIDAYNILANPYTTSRPAVTLGERELFTQIPEPFTDNYTLGDLNMRYDFGKVNLTSITSYSYRDILVVRDADALTCQHHGRQHRATENVYTLNAPLDDATKTHVVHAGVAARRRRHARRGGSSAASSAGNQSQVRTEPAGVRLRVLVRHPHPGTPRADVTCCSSRISPTI